MLKITWLLIKNTIVGWQRDDASQLAASLAFYAILSLAPLVVIIISMSGFFFSEAAVQGQLVSSMDEWIGIRGAELLQTIIASAGDSRSGIPATILSALTMLFGSTHLFLGIQTALDRVWGVQVEPGRGIWMAIKHRLLSFAIVLGLGFLALLFLVASTIMTAISVHFSQFFPVPAYLRVINFVVSFLVVTVLFAVIYKVLPDVKLAWKDVWVGSAVTSLLFTFGRYLIAVYLGITGAGSTYGAAASLFVLLLWVYYSAQVFLLGAEFTAVYTQHHGSSLVPDRNGDQFRHDVSPSP